MIAYFERFTLTMPEEAVRDCSHSGAVDNDVDYWATRLDRTLEISPEKLKAELKEYGAWREEELADDAANWKRVIWLAASQIKENQDLTEN